MAQELKGLQPITDKLNEFLEQFELEARPGTDFGFFYSENVVEYSFLVPEESNKNFMDSVYTWDPEVDMDIFLWSILHEVGHNETWDDVTDKEWKQSEKIKKSLEQDKDGKYEKEDYYTHCMDEVRATEWAVEYANTHIEELMNLWKELQPLIMEFYEINNIEQ